MGQRTSSRRAAALRKAREAKAQRDAERWLREQRIEAALADFFESAARAEQIRADAGRRADKILQDAEETARAADAQAGAAIRTLRDLGQTNAEIAELCGLSVPVVRAMANSSFKDDVTGPAIEAGDSGASSSPERPGPAPGAQALPSKETGTDPGAVWGADPVWGDSVPNPYG